MNLYNFSKYFSQTIRIFFIQRKSKYVITILLLVTSVVLIINIINYNIQLGYDAAAHKWYVEVMPLNLPTDQDTYEFFSPPLPYLAPSIVDSICDKLVDVKNNSLDCEFIYGKVTQIIQSFMFLAIIFFYINICNYIFPKNNEFLISTVLLLILIPANYKTFSMLRGEPYISFFISWFLFVFCRLIKKEFKLNKNDILSVGILLGLLGLSRQWAFLFLLSFGIYSLSLFKLNDKAFNLKLFKHISSIFILAFIISGWFYINLFLNYGSFTTFNEIPQEINIRNNPESFYTSTGLKDLMLFKEPFRGTKMQKGFFPIMHSDVWGDYWGYFLVRTGREGYDINIQAILPYLGKVNFLALIPSSLYLIGIIFSFKYMKRKNENINIIRSNFYLLLNIFLIIGWLGFIWFNTKYPEEKMDTVKATYVIYLINLLPFYGSLVLNKLRKINSNLYNSLISILFIILFYNIPAMITRF